MENNLNPDKINPQLKLNLSDVKGSPMTKQKSTNNIMPKYSVQYGMHSTRNFDRPKTNIEKIIELLRDIQEKFREYENDEYFDKTGCVINEVLGNKMYLYDEDQSDPEQSKFLKLYSPDFDKDKDSSKFSTKNLSVSSPIKIKINKEPKDGNENSMIVLKSGNDQDSEENDFNDFTISITKPLEKSSEKHLKLIDCKEFGTNFDVFKYADEVGRIFLVRQVALSAFAYKDVISLLKTTYLDNYLEELRIGYTKEPFAYYHNDFHACDVLQGTVDMVVNGNLDVIADLQELDILATFYASLIHDYKHPGFNNGFLINSKSEIAFQFNDKSVLENYHLAEAFKLVNKNNCNIFEKLNTSDFKTFRKRVIEMVLATDMMNHSKLIGTISSKLAMINSIDDGNQSQEVKNNFTIKSFLDRNKEANKSDIQQDLINFVLHAVDIGHAAKPFELELKWADLVTAEFLNQGDTEKKLGLPISFLCDRTTSNVPASQVGFIAGIVAPTFQLIVCLLPKMNDYIELINTAKAKWEELKNKDIKDKESQEVKK